MTRMNWRFRCVHRLSLLFMALTACVIGYTQQASGDVPVVREAVLKTSGEISGEFRPVSNSEAKVQGGCNESFANFGVIYENSTWRKVSVTVMTEDGIGLNQVGPIALDWALVSFTDSNYDATQYRGPAEFVIREHDGSAPRMTGTVKGTLAGYGGMLGGAVSPDQSIEFEFTFDIAVACGATE